jgi:cation diffusion facilitator CzcD-associated flavoprotein CzcO
LQHFIHWLEYYKCFQQKKANLLSSKFQITRDGIQTEYGEIPLDVIILATGFDLSYKSFPVKLVGKQGVVLQNIPTSDFKGYLGVSLSQFPNLFVLVGPNTGLGHNSIIFMIENQVNYAMHLIAHMISKNAKSLEIKSEKVFQFNEELAPEFANKVWRGCDSWYVSLIVVL